jgi:hypothetical protein
MPVLSEGYVVSLQIFSPDLLILNQTGFLTITQRTFSWFVGEEPVLSNYYE